MFIRTHKTILLKGEILLYANSTLNFLKRIQSDLKKKETVHQSDCIKIYICSKNITNVLSIKVACGQIRVLMPSQMLAVLELCSKQFILELYCVICTASEFSSF